MTKRSNLLILSLIVTIGLFVYLVIHHYALKVGLGGDSLCAINSKINCDVTAASSYAELAGIPIAVLGGVFHFFLLAFVIFYKMDWVENTSYLQKTIRSMLLGSVLVSIIAGSISAFVLKVLCPVCTATYVFSVINLFLGWNLVQNFNKDFNFSNYFTEYRSHLIALACIPAVSWVIAGMIETSYGFDQIKKQIPEKLAIWAAGKQNNFDKSVGLSNGVENPRITLVEFADFKCPHCKTAGQTLEVFLKGRTDVQFTFKPFPLDGNCNPGIEQKGDNSRCVLAAFTLCAEKLAQKGWAMHSWIFERQEKLIKIADVKTLLPEIEADLGLNKTQLSDCADSAETFDMIRKSAEEGKAANVEGTPTIYMNGKKLPWGHVLEVLMKAAGK